MKTIQRVHQLFQPFISKRQERKLRIQNEPLFLKRLHHLVKEGYALDDALFLILPHHIQSTSDLTERIHAILLGGGTPLELFQELRLTKVNIAPIVTAGLTSDIHTALEQMHQMTVERMRLTTLLKKLITYPFVLFVCFVSIIFGYRLFFLPRMATVFQNQESSDSWFAHLITYFLTVSPDLVLAFVLISAVFGIYLYRKVVKQGISDHHFLLKNPLLLKGIQHYATYSFSLEFGRLLRANVDLQDALIYLTKEEYNPYVQLISQEMYEALSQGESLIDCLDRHPFLLASLSSFAEHGAKRSLLGEELVIYSEVLLEQMIDRTEILFSLIQPVAFVVLGVGVIATYLSMLLPMYELINQL